MLMKLGQRHRALQSAAQDLERQRATDSLRKGLEKRPEKEELIERIPSLLLPFPLSLNLLTVMVIGADGMYREYTAGLYGRAGAAG